MNTPKERLEKLERRFSDLETAMPDSPQKEALSVLHGIVQEMQRTTRMSQRQAEGAPAVIDVANLYRRAPTMEGAAVSTPLAAGTMAPDFTLPDAEGRPVRLSDLRGGAVVLAFYPLDWSPGCSQQLDLYQGETAEFEKRRAHLLGISVDSIYSHGAWAAVRGLRMPLLADFQPKGEVARRYRIYREQDGFSERVVYVVDASGRIQGHQLAPHLHHVPDVGELLGMLDGLARNESATVEAEAVL